MNIIVFVNDSLRPDHTSTYGYHRETTPNLDTLAEDGYVFNRAYSQGSWTVPSAGSIFTSTYPLTHGSLYAARTLRTDVPTIASELSDLGFHTVCISTMFKISKERGYGRGFDEFRRLSPEYSATRPDIAKKLSDTVCEWLDSAPDEPFFLFVWSSGTHLPFKTPDEHDPIFSNGDMAGETNEITSSGTERLDEVRALYDDCIRYADDQFGRILSKLEGTGLNEDTCIVSTADHGEVFDEHYRFETSPLRPLLRHAIPRSVAQSFRAFRPYAYGGHFDLLPYEELLRVPLVIRPPGGTGSRREIDELVELIDIGPTLLDLLGADPEIGQGSSLTPLMNRNGAEGKRYTYSTSPSRYGDHLFHSVADGEYKYVRITKGPAAGSTKARTIGALYRIMVPTEVVLDLENDERVLSNPPSGVLERFRDVYQHWIDEHSEPSGAEGSVMSEEIEIDRETKDQLRLLGYK